MDKESLQTQFQGITGLEGAEAFFFLETANWDLQAAVDAYFASKTEAPVEEFVPKSGAPKPTNPPAASQPKSKPTSGGIRTFGEISKGKDEGQNYYTGGEKSGMMVVDPKKKDELVNEVLENAKKLGAKSIDEVKKEESQPFGGTGFKLGKTEKDTVAVPSTGPEKITSIKLIFWKTGFSVDDGPLRQYTDPANQEFLDSVNKGMVPRELWGKTGSRDVDIQLIDKKGEDYKPPPKPPVKPFSGSGQALGRAPSTTTTPAAQPAAASSTPQPPTLDESKPVTTIQIRLADGSRLQGKFNHTHTIADLKNFVQSAKPGAAFDLITTYPQKVLTDNHQTLAEAGLLNAVVVQKAK